MQAPDYYVDERDHLGGYIRGGDPATYYPRLWRWIVEELGVDSVLDVGCGEGHALDFFRNELECYAVGIDGVPQVSSWIHETDFTEGPSLRFSSLEFDLVWSCEFVEHVEERYIPNFLPSFQQAPLILMTHAVPGQAGHHHVNCQSADYWQGVMAAIGYSLNEGLTLKTRLLAGMDALDINHYRDRGLAFVRS